MDNVYASRLGSAARHSAPGGDSIDHGWSLLKLLHEAGFDVVVRERAMSAMHVGQALNKVCNLPPIGGTQRSKLILQRSTKPRPIDEWHEDMGEKLWWCWESGAWLGEAPYVGSPLDCGFTVECHTHTAKPAARFDVGGWPGYHTHFTDIPERPEEPAQKLEPSSDDYGG